MVDKWLSLLAFTGGLIAGRELKAKKVKVPPSVVFYPPSSYLEKAEEKIDVRSTIEKIAKQKGIVLTEKELNEYVEYYSRLAELLRAREKYLWMIEKTIKAFCDRMISRRTYLSLMERYEEKLANVEMELRRFKRA